MNINNKIHSNKKLAINTDLNLKIYKEELPESYKILIKNKKRNYFFYEDFFLLKSDSYIILLNFRDSFSYGFVNYFLYDINLKKVFFKTIKLKFPYSKLNLSLDLRESNSFISKKKIFFSSKVINDSKALIFVNMNFKKMNGISLPLVFSAKLLPYSKSLYQIKKNKKKKEEFLVSRLMYNYKCENSFLQFANQKINLNDMQLDALTYSIRANYNFKGFSLFFLSNNSEKKIILQLNNILNNFKKGLALESYLIYGEEKIKYKDIIISKSKTDDNKYLYILDDFTKTIKLMLIPLKEKKINSFPYINNKEKIIFVELSGVIHVNNLIIEIQNEIGVLKIDNAK